MTLHRPGLRHLIIGVILLGMLAPSAMRPQPSAAQPACTISGTRGADRLTGTAGNDVICGLGGDDVIQGGGGNDILRGGAGNDTLIGGGGQDVLAGGAGIDTVSYAERTGGVAISLDGAANDGAAGEGDRIGTDVENATGGRGSDTLIGNAGANTLTGGAGGDTIDGGAGVDTIDGGTGGDTIDGDAGGDTIDGGTGGDTIDGGTGDDTIDSGTGGDTIGGGEGGDTIDGGEGIDTIDGGTGDNFCLWEAGETRSTTCDYDLIAPTLTDFQVSAQQVDVTDGPVTVTVEIAAADTGGAGLDPEAAVFAQRITAGSTFNINADTVTQISGDANSGRWLATYTIPQTTRPGAWTLGGATLFDRSGNARTFFYDEIAASGWQSTLQVVNRTEMDLTPPSIDEVTFSTSTLAAGESLTVEVAVSDSGDGVTAVFLTYFIKGSEVLYLSTPGTRISGDDASARHRFVVTFPIGTTPGTWRLSGVYVVDANRNSTYLLTGALANRGFPTEVVVTP